MYKSLKVLHKFVKANTKFSAGALIALILLLPALAEFLFAA